MTSAGKGEPSPKVTEELLGIARTSVEEAMGRATTEPGLDDAAALIAVFEAIRPFGRQWYLLYSDAITRSLRDEEMRVELAAQRERLRDEIGQLLTTRMEAAGERPLLPAEDLAQLLVGIFVDLMVREQMDGRDVTELAATTILGTLRAFITPRDDPQP